MTREERLEIVEAAIAMTPPGTTVVVGVSHTSVQESTLLALHAQEHGASGLLCSAPYYFANEPEGMLRFFAQLDAAIDTDLVLYDNPVATKTADDANVVVGWSERLEHLCSVKLTDHDLGKIAIWRDAGLSVLAGDDDRVPVSRGGVDGAITIAPPALGH